MNSKRGGRWPREREKNLRKKKNKEKEGGRGGERAGLHAEERKKGKEGEKAMGLKRRKKK